MTILIPFIQNKPKVDPMINFILSVSQHKIRPSTIRSPISFRPYKSRVYCYTQQSTARVFLGCVCVKANPLYRTHIPISAILYLQISMSKGFCCVELRVRTKKIELKMEPFLAFYGLTWMGRVDPSIRAANSHMLWDRPLTRIYISCKIGWQRHESNGKMEKWEKWFEAFKKFFERTHLHLSQLILLLVCGVR